MITRPNSLPNIRIYGNFSVTPGCNGPFLSQDRGLDKPCCARCHIIRQRIYREIGIVTGNPLEINYLKDLALICPEVETSYSIANCGSPMISTTPYESELEYESVRGFLHKQFNYRRDKKVGWEEVNTKYVAMTNLNKPVICKMPSDRYYENIGGDDGVSINSGKLVVSDMKKAIESGKWLFVINYYQICKILFGVETLENCGDLDGDEMLLW
jgi:hypothetical protein